MKLQDLTRVANLKDYWREFYDSNLTQQQVQKVVNISNAENLIRHVNLMSNQAFLEMVEKEGFRGMLMSEDTAEYFDALIGNPALVPFVQQLILLLAITGWMAEEEADSESHPEPSP